MKSYGCIVHFQSPPAAVYEALITRDGLAGWWTTACEVATEIGQVSRFDFGESYFEVKLIKLVPGQKVEWRCVGHRLLAPDEIESDDEWIGTTLKFHLSEQPDGGTELWFQHAGLTEDLESFEISNDFWEYYLCASLKEYVDAGKGRPHDGSAEAVEDPSDVPD